MSFAKKTQITKGTKKPEKTPFEQIQIILGNEYTVEQIQNVLKQTNDIQAAIKQLKQEREAMQMNSQALKFQQLNKGQQERKKINKYSSKWIVKTICEWKSNQSNLVSEICKSIEKIRIDSDTKDCMLHNFSTPSRDCQIQP